MKNTIPLILCLLLACSSQTSLEELYGTWDFVEVVISGNDATPDLDPHSDRWIRFKKDGTYQSGGSLGPNEGKFTFIQGILELDSNAGEGDDSEWTVEISGDTLRLLGMGTEGQSSSQIVTLRADPEEPHLSMTVVPMPASIRALEISDHGRAWFAGSGGLLGSIGPDGKLDTLRITYNGTIPEFRSLAITDQAVYVLSIASPALLYRSDHKGKEWELVYTNDHDSVFFDSMRFWDNSGGIAVGDAINGCMTVLLTSDGGNSWNLVDCNDLPPARKGEGCFAASNGNISLVGDNAWFCTTAGRVFHSPDRGLSWEVYETPIKSDSAMSGIFSMDLTNGSTGMVMGGDWTHKDINTGNKAITRDGGRTWKLTADGMEPGYRSCVLYDPSDPDKIWAVGSPGISYSSDGGHSWNTLSTYPSYTMRLGTNHAWLAGDRHITKLVISGSNSDNIPVN